MQQASSPTPRRCLDCEVEWQADDACFLCGRYGTPGRVAPIVHPPATAWPGPLGSTGRVPYRPPPADP